MPAKDVKAYVKRNKNDSVDAAACCEAVRRPTVRTVPVKTPEQQAQLMQHRIRDLLGAPAHAGHQCAALASG
jgi:transposase